MPLVTTQEHVGGDQKPPPTNSAALVAGRLAVRLGQNRETIGE